MDILTIAGFVAGIVVLIFGILSNGSLSAFYDVGSIFVTVGGTIAAMMINFPFKSLKNVFPAVLRAFFSKPQTPLTTIENIVELSEKARKDGILSLEQKADEYNDEFLKKGVMTIIDAYDPEKAREVLETEISYIQDRHCATQAVLEKGAAYAPAFGMIGTLIGLINMLKQLDKPETLGPNMSIALVTTFYGSVLANIVFLPLAGKLKALDEDEMLCKQLIVEGVLSIQVGENPRLINDKLLSYLPNRVADKKSTMKKRRGSETA